jgi:hypothetical protein
MSSEPSNQPVSSVCDHPAPTGALVCPMCGAALVPLRGQWRCSRCYFALCAGCEPMLSYESADRGD